MHFISFLTVALAAAGTTFAAPAAEASVQSMTVANSQWTIRSFKRTCNPANTSCNYSFGINANNGTPVTNCAFAVNGNPASRATYQNVKCGAYTIGSTWSGQFGPGNGFQTLSVVNGKQIAYPAYTDNQLQNGQVVSPDQSYPVQRLP